MTSDGTTCYQINQANQIDKVYKCSNNQTIAEYVYDYNGLRMVKRNFVGGSLDNTVTSWSDSFETKVINGGATTNTSYYFANGQLIAKKDNSGTRTYFHNDHLGSASLVTNQSGTQVETTTYDPWGKVNIGGTASKFLYTGQERDGETGLHYYNARYYNPDIRRFTQPDDIIQDVYDPQTLNRYSYVRNNPLRYTDPTGHCFTPLLRVVCGGIAAVYQVAKNFVTKSAPKAPPVKPYTPAPVINIPQSVSKQIPSVKINNPPSATTTSTGTGFRSTLSGQTNNNSLVTGSNSPIKIETKYVRPNGATTKEMREAVNVPGTPCHTCGKIGEKNVPDHVPSLVEQYYETGIIDVNKMKSLESVLPQCLTCSRIQGGTLSNYSKKKAIDLGL